MPLQHFAQLSPSRPHRYNSGKRKVEKEDTPNEPMPSKCLRTCCFINSISIPILSSPSHSNPVLANGLFPKPTI